MRTTVRIDDDLLGELKEYAHREKVSVAQLVNETVRLGFESLVHGKLAPRKPYREKTFNTGKPKVDLTKASQLAAELEDEEILRKQALGK